MLQWSKYFQTPNYLDLYRKMIMNKDYLMLISKWIGLKDNMSILDVGCGTGAFSYYLASETRNSFFHGIDIEPDFIEKANIKRSLYANNIFDFSVGNAYSLPFEDNSFDLVMSYTVLTNLNDGKKALSEMYRVAKPEGNVVSITTQSFKYIPEFEGDYSSENYYFEYKYIRNVVLKAYQAVQPQQEYFLYGTSPKKIPLLFAKSGLRDIRMYPIGYSFSLSNSIYSDQEKREFIELIFIAEMEKFENYMNLKQFNSIINPEIATRYMELLKIHKKRCLDRLDTNDSWEWFGGSQLLMIGTK